MRRIGTLVATALVLAACASESNGSSDVTSDSITPSKATSVPEQDSPEPVTPEGFDRVRATVTASDGTICEVCLWLAETGDQRSRGLMLVTDLGAADGMAFVYPAPHTGNFWMKNTLLPLSIAFFDPAGTYLDAFDMEPCTAEPCDLYPTPQDFLVAVETERGGLDELGIGPGSTLELTGLPCE